MSQQTGALGAHWARTERWAALLSQAESGSDPIFPGARLAAVAVLLNQISEGNGTGKAAQLDQVSLVAQDSRIVFQRCPWNTNEVLFVVLPDSPAAAASFALLRLVLESIRRDVAIVRAPRVEERCWN